MKKETKMFSFRYISVVYNSFTLQNKNFAVCCSICKTLLNQAYSAEKLQNWSVFQLRRMLLYNWLQGDHVPSHISLTVLFLSSSIDWEFTC